MLNTKLRDIFLLAQLFMALASVHHVRATVEMPDIVWREEWGARQPKAIEPLKESPAPFVVVHHSATRSCNSKEKCKKLVKSFQNYHMDTHKWDDIGYNFVIGEDGYVYEGRGWGITGSHATGYNSKSIGICITGMFTDHLPNKDALDTLRQLIVYGVRSNKISEDYKLIGHSQAQATLCPGQRFYDLLTTFDHWTPVSYRTRSRIRSDYYD